MSENTKKDEIAKIEDAVVEETVAKKIVAIEEVEEEKEVPSLTHTDNGAIGSGTNKGNQPKSEPKSKAKVEKEDKVAVHSTSNLYSDEAGKITIGYNILTKKNADWWISKRPKQVRLAQPSELAEAFA